MVLSSSGRSASGEEGTSWAWSAILLQREEGEGRGWGEGGWRDWEEGGRVERRRGRGFRGREGERGRLPLFIVVHTTPLICGQDCLHHFTCVNDP